MPSQNPSLNELDLFKAYKENIASAWTAFKKKHLDHAAYALVLYGVEGRPWLSPHVLTQEGLSKVIAKYMKDDRFETEEEARSELRYSVVDSPYAFELESHFSPVQAILEPLDDLPEIGGYKLLAEVATKALQALDKEGVFGDGAKREELLLAIIIDEVEGDWTSTSVRKLNPPSIRKRFEVETRKEGVFAACSSLVIAPGGQSIYAACSRENPEGKPGTPNEFLSEFIRLDVRDGALVRRWTVPANGYGVFHAPTSQSVVLVRRKYEDGNRICKITLTRFSEDSGSLLQERTVIGEPSALAFSHDEHYLAIAMQDSSIHIFDRELRETQVHSLETKAHSLCFLRSGSLLIGSELGVLCLHPDGVIRATPRMLACDSLVVDGEGQFLAESRWLPLFRRLEQPETEITLVRLPEFEVVREFTVQGCRAVMPALSSDGHFLAFGARKLAKPENVVVFDTRSGKEIGRTRSRHIQDLAFMPEGQTLALSNAGLTTGEAIKLWRFLQ